MRRWRTGLGPVDVQDARGEIDLIPAKVDQLDSPQAVAEGQQDHGRVAVARSRLDQSLDLGLSEVLSRPVLSVLSTPRCANCRNIVGWRGQLEARICHGNPPFPNDYCRNNVSVGTGLERDRRQSLEDAEQGRE